MSDEKPSEKFNRISRRAELPITDDGDPLGVCLYLTPAELETLGISLSEVEELTYTIDAETELISVEGGQE